MTHELKKGIGEELPYLRRDEEDLLLHLKDIKNQDLRGVDRDRLINIFEKALRDVRDRIKLLETSISLLMG